MDKYKRLRDHHQKQLSQALCGMFKAGQGSPDYKDWYKQYRHSASILAQPQINPKILRSQIKDR